MTAAKAVGASQGSSELTGRSLGVHPYAAGRLVEFPASEDEVFNAAAEAFQDARTDWSAGELDLGLIARSVHRWAVSQWDRLVLPVVGRPVRRTPFFLRFARTAPQHVAHFRDSRNDAGIRFEQNLNPRYLTRTDVQIAAVLLHEVLHQVEHQTRTAPQSRNNFHSRWFRNTSRTLGIPCSKYGREEGILDPSPFMTWAREEGLTGQPFPVLPTVQKHRLPKRVPWVCQCMEPDRIVLHVARGSALHARCERCHELFTRKEAP